MKNLLLFLAAFSAALNCTAPLQVDAAAAQSYYAKVATSDVYFYSSPQDNADCQLFEIPTGYFVLLDGNAGDNFYSCRYSDLTGFVKKDSVVPIIGTPVHPYADSTSLFVVAPDGIELRSSPYKMPTNTLAKVAYLEDRIIYYGKIDGDELVPGLDTKTWYYCKVMTQQTTRGYLFNYFAIKKNPIPLNEEEFVAKTGELFPEPTLAPPTGTALSGTAKTLIIVGVSLPCVVVLYLLIKPTLLTDKQKKGKAKVRHKKRDYFEYDESDLN